MDKLRINNSAYVKALLLAATQNVASALLMCGKGLLAQLQASREREAARVFARYRHLTESDEWLQQIECDGTELGPQATPAHTDCFGTANQPCPPKSAPRLRAPRALYVDPTQGFQ